MCIYGEKDVHEWIYFSYFLFYSDIRFCVRALIILIINWSENWSIYQVKTQGLGWSGSDSIVCRIVDRRCETNQALESSDFKVFFVSNSRSTSWNRNQAFQDGATRKWSAAPNRIVVVLLMFFQMKITSDLLRPLCLSTSHTKKGQVQRSTSGWKSWLFRTVQEKFRSSKKQILSIEFPTRKNFTLPRLA